MEYSFKTSLLFHHFPDNLLKIFLLHGAHLHIGIALQRDEEESRNAADAEDGSQLGFLVDIHLIEIYLAGIFPGKRFYHGAIILQGPHQVV